MNDPFNYGNPNLDSLMSEKPFVRSNAGFPELLSNTHIIDICGKQFSIRQLEMGFYPKHLTVCTECAGNSRTKLPYKIEEGLQWDNRAVSNVTWRGVLLSELLPPKPTDVVEVVFTSLDKKFTRSLPIDVVYNEPVIIAYGMYDSILSKEHGGPARLIVPGWYGMASVKWLDKIYFTNKPFVGEYQTNKYTSLIKDGTRSLVTKMLPKSIITNISFQNPYVIYGKAWGGNEITEVEVLINDKIYLAKIADNHLGKYAWKEWKLSVDFEKGEKKIGSRAIDSEGVCQPDASIENYWGYVNNAIQYTKIIVE